MTYLHTYIHTYIHTYPAGESKKKHIKTNYLFDGVLNVFGFENKTGATYFCCFSMQAYVQPNYSKVFGESFPLI